MVRIGAGAGYSGDRIEPAVELVRDGRLDYIVFECLAERTIALAQRARHADSGAGYDPMLDDRMRAVLPAAVEHRVRIVTNMGAANPVAASHRAAAVARECGLTGLRIAAVTGDDVLDIVRRQDPPMADSQEPVSSLGPHRLISANAYLGSEGIVEALGLGADVVITGRVADPALFLGPLVHEFAWPADDWEKLGRGILVGHLLECAGQLTGGYFADPGIRDVPDMARLGFPLADVSADGNARLGKVAGSGGRLDRATCTEQLLYEIGDPARYVTPDVCADFSGVEFEEVGPDAVLATGAGGNPRPDTLKVSVGYLDGYIGDGQISYVGANAVARARLALDIVRERLSLTGVEIQELRSEIIGVDAVHAGAGGQASAAPPEVRARVAGRAATLAAARRIGAEVEALYTNGPAGGGGVTTSATPVVAIGSTLLPRALVRHHVEVIRS
jgi:hypothetical protein